MPSSTRRSLHSTMRLLLALAQDTFAGRTVYYSWGTTSDGQNTWSFPVGLTTQQVSGGTGQLTGRASNTIGFLGSGTLTDAEALVRVSGSTTGCLMMAVLRATSSNTYYEAGIGTGEIVLSKVVSGTTTDLATSTLSWSAGTSYWIRFRVLSSQLAVKVWQDGTSEPSDWSLSAFDTGITAAGQFGIRGKPGSTSAIVYFDSYVVYQALPVAVMHDASVRLSLSANRKADTAMRLRAAAYTLPSVPMRLIIALLSNLIYGNMGARVRMAAIAVLSLASRVVVLRVQEPGALSRFLLRVVRQADAALRFFLGQPAVAEWTNACSRISLALAQDTFSNRITSSGWGGTASDGQNSWAITGTITSYISQGWGQFTGNNVNVVAFLGSRTLADAEVLVLVGASNAAAALQVLLRATSGGTHYRAGITGTNSIAIQRVVAGVVTTLASSPYSWQVMIGYWVRFRVIGSSLLLNVWPEGEDEPGGWTLTTIDTGITAAGQFGVRSKTGSASDVNYFTSFVATGAIPIVLVGQVASRIKLRGLRLALLPLRLRLSAFLTRELSSRVRLASLLGKDALLRLSLSAGSSTLFRFLPTRLILAVLSRVDTSVRLSLLKGAALFARTRLSLVALSLKDAASRLLVGVGVARGSAGTNTGGRVRHALAQDSFVRPPRAEGWGLSADGLSWSFTNALTLSITGNAGVVTGISPNTIALLGTAPLGDADVCVRVRLSTPGSSTQSADSAGVVVRATSSTTYYRAHFDSQGSFVLTRVLLGVVTDLSSQTQVNPSAGVRYWIRLRAIGESLCAKEWQDGTPEPSGWQLSVTDTAISGMGQVGLRVRMTASSVATVAFDTFTVVDASPSSPFEALLTRLRLSCFTAPPLPLRLSLLPAPPPFSLKNLGSRLILFTVHFQHMASRIRMAATMPRDGRVRLPLSALSLRDGATRILLAYASTWTSSVRMVLSALLSAHLSVRLCLAALSPTYDGITRARVLTATSPDGGTRLLLLALPSPLLTEPPPPEVSSLPSPRLAETFPVALTTLVTYAVNGTPLAQQPISATAPRLDGGAVQAGATFSMLFTNPSSALLAQLPDNAQVTLTFALEVGTPMTAPVHLSCLLSPDETLLTCTATVTTTTQQNVWVTDTQFL